VDKKNDYAETVTEISVYKYFFTISKSLYLDNNIEK
jgi:hypothetical protein